MIGKQITIPSILLEKKMVMCNKVKKKCKEYFSRVNISLLLFPPPPKKKFRNFRETLEKQNLFVKDLHVSKIFKRFTRK